jgi:hypothetical protein
LRFSSLLYNQRILVQMGYEAKSGEMGERCRHERLFVFVFPDL